MRRRTGGLVRAGLATLAVAALTACGGGGGGETGARGGAEPPAAAPAPNLPVDRAVAPEALSPFLPESFLGLERSVIEPISESFQEAVSTGAEAEYRGAGASILAPVSIAIRDHGASEYWLRTYGILEIETEERGEGGSVTRHVKFRGYPTSEYELRAGSSIEARMEIFVAGRFLVDIRTRGVPLDDVRTAAGALDLDGLARVGGE